MPRHNFVPASRPTQTGSVPIIITAALAIALLFAVLGSRAGIYASNRQSDTSLEFERTIPPEEIHLAETDWHGELVKLGIIATSSPEFEYSSSSDPLGRIGDILAEQAVREYISLKQGNSFTAESARAAGATIGQNVLPSPLIDQFSIKDVLTTGDTSLARTLSYRADMRDATAPLISDHESEFALFSAYVETRDPDLLDILTRAAQNYEKAAENMSRVEVPVDAAEIHLEAMNAVKKYGNTVERLVLFADKPLASLALLRTYNDVEREMLMAFDALAQYYVRKSESQ